MFRTPTPSSPSPTSALHRDPSCDDSPGAFRSLAQRILPQAASGTAWATAAVIRYRFPHHGRLIPLAHVQRAVVNRGGIDLHFADRVIHLPGLCRPAALCERHQRRRLRALRTFPTLPTHLPLLPAPAERPLRRATARDHPNRMLLQHRAPRLVPRLPPEYVGTPTSPTDTGKKDTDQCTRPLPSLTPTAASPWSSSPNDPRWA